jgi:hypothetical protein
MGAFEHDSHYATLSIAQPLIRCTDPPYERMTFWDECRNVCFGRSAHLQRTLLKARSGVNRPRVDPGRSPVTLCTRVPHAPEDAEGM